MSLKRVFLSCLSGVRDHVDHHGHEKLDLINGLVLSESKVVVVSSDFSDEEEGLLELSGTVYFQKNEQK